MASSNPTTISINDLTITRVSTGPIALSDADFAWVNAIKDLTIAIERLRLNMN